MSLPNMPKHIQILRALHNLPAFESKYYLHHPPQTPESCYNWLIPCDPDVKELVESALRPHVPANQVFDVTRIYLDEEQGTQWAIFYGPMGGKIPCGL